MTAAEFRSLALSLPGVSEEAHMGHPDFRVGGKIFATLGPDETWGTAKLTPEQQALFVRTEPAVFRPVNGAWGVGAPPMSVLKWQRSRPCVRRWSRPGGIRHRSDWPDYSTKNSISKNSLLAFPAEIGTMQMRLEFLPNYPLIRLFDFTTEEAGQLAAAVDDLAANRIQRVSVQEFPWLRATDGCQLVLCLRPWDQSVIQIGPAMFECGFTANTWKNVSGLIEPFASGSGGFQWLAGVPGEAALLLSTSGQW